MTPNDDDPIRKEPPPRAWQRMLSGRRLDRAEEFAAKGVTLTAGSVPVRIELPAFATFTLGEHRAPA
jgi:hypothetical protein